MPGGKFRSATEGTMNATAALSILNILLWLTDAKLLSETAERGLMQLHERYSGRHTLSRERPEGVPYGGE
jgi:hypothetical protein